MSTDWSDFGDRGYIKPGDFALVFDTDDGTGKNAPAYCFGGADWTGGVSLVARAPSGGFGAAFRASTGGAGGAIVCQVDATDILLAVFNSGSSYVGGISTNGTTTSYNTTSDAALKKNIAAAEEAGEAIDAIQIRQFDFKSNDEHVSYGVIAQELVMVRPEAVTPGTDDRPWSVDHSKLVPMLIREIQSLRVRIAALEA